jgi:hypothetical protein
MARSIHQAANCVFKNKLKREVDEMCNPDNLDIDVIELYKKHKIKKWDLNERKSKKYVKKCL